LRSEFLRLDASVLPVDTWVSVDLGGSLQTTLRCFGASSGTLQFTNSPGSPDFFTMSNNVHGEPVAGQYLTIASDDKRLYVRRPTGSVASLEVWMVKA